jgi:hypothetical protein
MAQAAAVWRTRDGIRRTSPTDTLSVDVSTTTNLKPVGSGGEGWIDRVEFSVSENGGAPTVHVVSAPSERRPNYASAPSPIPGVTDDMAPSHWWGITLACSGAAAGIVVAYGRVEVTAVVYSGAGTATPLVGSIVFYNDADGVDRRPNTDVVYVDENGNDAWDGSSPTFVSGLVGPKATPAKALGTGECGGKTVHLAGAVGWFGSLAGIVFTSDRQWCTFVLAPGATLRRHASASTTFATSAGQRFRLRVVGDGTPEVRGAYLDIKRGSGGNVQVWSDGLRRHSEFYDPVHRKCSVRFVTESGGESIFNFVDETNDEFTQQFASNCLQVGINKGYGNFGDVHDCEIAYTMAEAFVSNNATDGNGQSFANVYYHDQVAGTGLVRGWFNSLVHGNLTVTTAGLPAGQAKLSQNGPMFVNVFGSDDTLAPVDIAFVGVELVGLSPTWKLRCTGMSGAGNNGDLPVIAAGYDGATPYVIVQNASAVPGVQTTGSLQTYYQPFGGPVDPHGDVWHAGGPHTNGILENLSASNVWHVQALFGEGGFGYTQDRLGIVNLALSSPYAGYDLAMAWSGSSNDVTVLGCTFDHGGNWSGSHTRLCMVDNVFQSINLAAGADAYIHANHFVSGSTYGTSATTGAWFTNRPINQLWSFKPADARLNTGSGLWSRPSSFRWPGATSDTRGADASVGRQNWGIDTLSVTPAASEALFEGASAVVMGSIAIAAANSEVLFESAPGAIISASISVSPPTNEAVLESSGSWVLGSFARDVKPSEVLWDSVASRVVMGDVAVSPAESITLWDGSNAQPVFGSVAVSPQAGEVVFESQVGQLLFDGTAIVPAPSEALFESDAAGAILGDVAVSPAPSEVLFESAEGVIVGDLVVIAAANVATFESVPGAAVLGSIAATAPPNESLVENDLVGYVLGSVSVTPARSDLVCESHGGSITYGSATVTATASVASFESVPGAAVLGQVLRPPWEADRPRNVRKLWMRLPWRKQRPFRGR